MRVIAGRCGGTALRGGHGPHFRPTAQVVKGSVFDTLYGRVQEAAVLDLFAGSGSLGIEALSRGASRAVFVEQDSKILRALRTNLDRCKVADQAEVIRGDAMKFLDQLIRDNVNRLWDPQRHQMWQERAKACRERLREHMRQDGWVRSIL